MFKLAISRFLLLILFFININTSVFSSIELGSDAIKTHKELTLYIEKNPNSWDSIVLDKYDNNDKSTQSIILIGLKKIRINKLIEINDKIYLKYLLEVYTNKNSHWKSYLSDQIVHVYLSLNNRDKGDKKIINYLKKIKNFKDKSRLDITTLSLIRFDQEYTPKSINKTEYLKKWDGASLREGELWMSLTMEARSGDRRAILLLLKKTNDYKDKTGHYLNALKYLEYVPQHLVREYVVINMFDDRNFTTNRLPKERFSYSRYFAKLLEKIDPDFPIKKTTKVLWLSEVDMGSIRKYYANLINKGFYKIPKKEAYFDSFYGVGLSTLFLHNDSSRGFQYFETAIELAPSNKKELLRNSIVKYLHENNKEKEASNFINNVQEKN